MNVIEKVFEGEPVRWWEEDNGTLWIDPAELGRWLGYEKGEERRAVLRLASRHRDQMSRFERTVKLTTPSGAQDCTIYEEHGAWIIAMKARTKKAKSVQNAIAELMTRFHRKARAGISQTPSEVGLIIEESGKMISAMAKALEEQNSAMREMASSAAKIMSLKRWHSNPNPLQKKLPFEDKKSLGES